MALDERISDLIGRIYDSVDDPARWERMLLDMKQLFGACFILETVADLRHHSMNRSTFYGSETAAFCDGVNAFQQGLYLDDPSFHWAIGHPNERFCDTSEIMPAEEWLKDEFVLFTRSYMGSSHWMLGYTPMEDELTFGLSIHPPADVGPLPPGKKALFKMLFEHMERAVRIHARPPPFSSADEPLVLLDRLGRIRSMSPAASDLVERRDGLSSWDKQLHAADSNATARLNAAILSALGALEHGTFGGAVALPRPSGKRDLLVTVTPLVKTPSPFEAFRPAALLRIVDPELTASPSAAERWACLFGLTPAEARFADALISRHQNLRHAADALGVTYATARVHLRHLLEKTGTHSQAQLARLLTRVE